MKLFGPILRWELIRIARRQRITLSRTLFALTLFLVAAIVYWTAYKGMRDQLPIREVARVTEVLFYGLLALLLVAVAAFTPQWTSDAITGEKERRTLPFLLLTDLTSREIILGKLSSRLTQLITFLLAGLPVLVGLQFFGGVEPAMVWIALGALAVTMWSIGSLAMLNSVYGKNPRGASQRTSQALALYVVGMMISGQLLRAFPSIGRWPGVLPFDLLDVHEWLNIANPLAAVEEITRTAGGTFGDTLWRVFRNYFLAHLALGFGFITLAILRLRPVAASLPQEGPTPDVRGGVALRRPSVGRLPVYWKMLWCDARPIKSRWGQTLTRSLYLLSYVPVVVVLVLALQYGRSKGAVQESINVYTRLVVTIVLSGMLLYVAGLAAGCIGRERTKQTLDELLLTDLSTDEILKQKWLASIMSVRWMMLWVILHWALAVAIGALHPLAVPALALLWIIDVFYAASLGMYFAARTMTTQKAHFWTSMTGLLLAIAPLSAGMLALWIIPGRVTWQTGLFVISPPAALGVAAFSQSEWQDMVHGRSTTFRPLIWGMAVGAIGHAIFAACLWVQAKRWFPRMIGR
jgi:ABC-type Na+ efflux pump permease subunit